MPVRHRWEIKTPPACSLTTRRLIQQSAEPYRSSARAFKLVKPLPSPVVPLEASQPPPMALFTPFSPTPQARESRNVSSQVGQVDGWHEGPSSCMQTSQICAALSPRPTWCLPAELSP